MELKIKEMRQKVGMSQEELADKIGKSCRGVQQWERGKSSPSANAVWDMCEALGCDPNTLLGWYDEHPEDMPRGARDSQVACSSPEGQEVGIALSESA